MNEELINRALRMILDRVHYYSALAEEEENISHSVKSDAISRYSAYRSAFNILYYAIDDNEECLKEFDYYNDKIEESE